MPRCYEADGGPLKQGTTKMKTIRGKIITFFILCFAFAGVLTLLHYENAFSLRWKIHAIEHLTIC